MHTATTNTLSPNSMLDMLMLKFDTSGKIEHVTDQVPAQCEAHGFSLLKAYDFYDILEGKGFPIERKVFVYEICKAKVASLMLAAHPEFSLFMPCKISVYEDRGKTVVSTMNMSMALETIQSETELFDAASAIFKSIQDMMKDLIESHG